MMAVGDAIAFLLSNIRNFQPDQFAKYHPSGTLGKLTAPVERLMRTGEQMRTAHFALSVRQALVMNQRHGRRTGAIVVTDNAGKLCGLFTDSDLVRLLEQRCYEALDQPIGNLMTKNPTVVTAGTMLRDALELLSSKKFSELPVVDHEGRPVGILDITDLIGLLPPLVRQGDEVDRQSDRVAA